MTQSIDQSVQQRTLILAGINVLNTGPEVLPDIGKLRHRALRVFCTDLKDSEPLSDILGRVCCLGMPQLSLIVRD